MARVVVIGGGISGLAAAHRLSELNPSLNLTLIEASGRLGGTLRTDQRDGFLIERGPDSFISEKPEAVALAQRLGIESRLLETNSDHRRSFIVRNGRLRPRSQVPWSSGMVRLTILKGGFHASCNLAKLE